MRSWTRNCCRYAPQRRQGGCCCCATAAAATTTSFSVVMIVVVIGVRWKPGRHRCRRISCSSTINQCQRRCRAFKWPFQRYTTVKRNPERRFETSFHENLRKRLQSVPSCFALILGNSCALRTTVRLWLFPYPSTSFLLLRSAISTSTSLSQANLLSERCRPFVLCSKIA